MTVTGFLGGSPPSKPAGNTIPVEPSILTTSHNIVSEFSGPTRIMQQATPADGASSEAVTRDTPLPPLGYRIQFVDSSPVLPDGETIYISPT
jgi:hypothetical protein